MGADAAGPDLWGFCGDASVQEAAARKAHGGLLELAGVIAGNKADGPREEGLARLDDHLESKSARSRLRLGRRSETPQSPRQYPRTRSSTCSGQQTASANGPG